jgi:PAS domain-containing protein
VIGMVFLIVRQLRRQHAAAQRKLSEKSQHLDTAINNMTQGLLLFDSSGRLVICNQQYIDMFGLSTDVVKPGCHLRDLIRHRQEARLLCRRRRRLLRPVSRSQRQPGSEHRDLDAGRAHDPADLQAVAGRRLGDDAGRRHRSAARPGQD